MPLPGKGCSHSKPIKLKVNLGDTNVVFTQPVIMAPTDSRKQSKPKMMRKTINGELSVCLNSHLVTMVVGV